METLIFIALCFSGIFSFAFGMAWFIPLASARSNIAKESQEQDIVFPLMDMMLILLDCIPIFWLLHIVPTSSAARDEVRRLWREEKSIRSSYYSFLISITFSFLLVGVLVLKNS